MSDIAGGGGGSLLFVGVFFFLLVVSSTGPDIWLEYAQYSIGGMGAAGGIARVRTTFERALTAVGLHMTKGAALWEAFREFEIAILSTLQVSKICCFSPSAQRSFLRCKFSCGM